jgi:hypothetical protein
VSSTPELESSEDVCPHLGLAEDADSHATFATDAHRCYRLEKPTRIAPNHQERYCLASTYVSCPIYQGEGIAATLSASGPASRAEPAAAATTTSTARLERPGAASRPPRLGMERTSPEGPRPRPGGVSMRNLTIGIFVLAAVVLGFSFWLLTQGDDDGGSPANPTRTPASTTTAATTPSTPTTPGTGTPGTTPTGTITPGAGTPTRGPGGNTYTVQEGDTCSAIAAQFNTTFEELRRLNPEINDECTNLIAGEDIVVP